MSTLRTFIAVPLKQEILATLSQRQNQLKALAPRHAVRWDIPDNFHVTLHFIGNVATADVARIVAVMEETIVTVSPFELTFEGIGCFPDYRRPRIIWIGLGGDTTPLIQMQHALGQALAQAIDFKPEARAYSPHLTVGRVKNQQSSAALRNLGQQLQQTQVGQIAQQRVTEISLFESTLQPTGPIYRPIAQAKFKGIM